MRNKTTAGGAFHRDGKCGASELREALIAFVMRQSSQRIGERRPGTTEVLESCFGRLKAIEDGRSKSGFTGLVLCLGAMVGKLCSATLQTMLERVGVREVSEWCRKKLGISVQSRRRQVYGIAACATNNGGWNLLSAEAEQRRRVVTTTVAGTFCCLVRSALVET